MLALLIILCITNVLTAIALKVFIKRALQYDQLFDVINEDVEMNLDYLNTMLSNHISTNAPEIVTLDKNLKLMRDRFTDITKAINGTIEKERLDE